MDNILTLLFIQILNLEEKEDKNDKSNKRKPLKWLFSTLGRMNIV